jgi:hypothetical protein
VFAERPTPSAITLNASEENIKDAASIFFIVFDVVRSCESERGLMSLTGVVLNVKTIHFYFAARISHPG